MHRTHTQNGYSEQRALHIVRMLCPDMQREIMSFVSPLVLYAASTVSRTAPSPLMDQEVDYLDHARKVRKIVTTDKYNWLLDKVNFHRRGYMSGSAYEFSSATMNRYSYHKEEDASAIQTQLNKKLHLRECNNISAQLKKIDYVISENMWYKVKI